MCQNILLYLNTSAVLVTRASIYPYSKNNSWLPFDDNYTHSWRDLSHSHVYLCGILRSVQSRDLSSIRCIGYWKCSVWCAMMPNTLF